MRSSQRPEGSKGCDRRRAGALDDRSVKRSRPAVTRRTTGSVRLCDLVAAVQVSIPRIKEGGPRSSLKNAKRARIKSTFLFLHFGTFELALIRTIVSIWATLAPAPAA